ncbi:MAG: AIR synthase-related protein, partial [Patescibacteria group bacterium]|nr:AIR synthase-related protein [Patescibacteria group bacterium]
MLHLFKSRTEKFEYCFNIQTSSPLMPEELLKLKQVLADGFVPSGVVDSSALSGKSDMIVELGPRMNFATAYQTSLLSVCRDCGLTKITRIERSRRYVPDNGANREEFIKKNHDRAVECHYPEPLSTFETGIVPVAVYSIPMGMLGPDALNGIEGLAMDEWDRNFYYDYFVRQENRDPTNVEISDLSNANSEHSRHGYFRGKQIIDGQEMPRSLMEIVKNTLAVNPNNSVIAFSDNSSAIRGYTVWTIIPSQPGTPSPFVKTQVTYHLVFTAETHNFPTGIYAFGGAETGTGGRERDNRMTGRGALLIAGTAGFCTASLLIPGYIRPWEDPTFAYLPTMETPLNIMIRASDGAFDYANKFGEPGILGFTREFDMRLPNGERWGFVKPIMFTGGIGQIDDRHIHKAEPKKGMKIVRIGGPAYRIGKRGGAASSLHQGENDAEIDFNAVQRGDGEMGNKVNRVIRTCVEMGDKNPILSGHDQGAGGPANNLKEIVGDAGGKIDIVKINIGDPTLSDEEIWICEYQEGDAVLIYPESADLFAAICEREKVPCEFVGEVTGDGRFVVINSRNGTTPVDIDLKKVLTGLPQKIFTDNTVDMKLEPPLLPAKLDIAKALHLVFQLIDVGSKRFLTSKVDRSVTGLIARQQCVGPLQLTLADCAVIAQSHFGLTGGAISIGEQPVKMLISPEA